MIANPTNPPSVTPAPSNPTTPEPFPPDAKPWYASAGVWGALVSLIGSALALLKVEVDPALLADVREWVLALVTLIGGGVALWGRVRARRRIGVAPPPAPRKPTLPPPASAVGLVVLFATFAMLVASSAGCGVLTSPGGTYIAADRATYDAIAPEYRDYVNADAALDADQRARRLRTLDSWRLRVEDAERRETAPADVADPATTPTGPSMTSPSRSSRTSREPAPIASQARPLNGVRARVATDKRAPRVTHHH